MSDSITRRIASAALLIICLSVAMPARSNDPQPVREAIIPAETKARLTLQSQISSKLSQVDDVVTATLAEAIYVEGQLVLPRGAEFHGRIIRVAPAKRGQRSSNMTINFESVVTPSGVIPIATQVTAIDDWDNEKSIKANREGKLKGGHRGEKTIDNVRKGASLGLSGGLVGLVLGGAAGASGRQVLGIGGGLVAAGMIGGALLTKGGEIRAGAGSILRIRFINAATLQVQGQPGQPGTQGIQKPEA